MDGQDRSVPIPVAQLSVRWLEIKRACRAHNCERENRLVLVAADAVRRPALAAVSAADVAFQMRTGRALAGDHASDQIADGNNPGHFTVLEHTEATNVSLGHQAQPFINASSGLRCRSAR